MQKKISILGGQSPPMTPSNGIKIKFCNYIMTKTKKWSNAYKKTINCKKPKGFSQKQYCKYGRNKTKGTRRSLRA